MFIARVGFNNNGEEKVAFAVVDGVDENGIPAADATVDILTSHPFGELVSAGIELPLTEVRLLPPIIPTKIIGIGKNYADHAAEFGSEVPDEPICFLKPTTSLIGTGDTIKLPWQSERVDHEVELAVVMGRLAKNVSPAEALDYVLGYTIANDVSARDIQKKDGQWTRAKGFDTFLPMGPWIATHLNPSELSLKAFVNDDIKQDGNTRDLVFDVAALVSFVSESMTLLPGDIILTGTPAGVSKISAGDVVQCSIEGLGELINDVADA